MADDVARLPLTPEQFEALKQALSEGPIRVPPDSRNPMSLIMDGRDATVLRKTITLLIDDILAQRQVLSETQIRAIAKEVAVQVYRELVKGIEVEMRGFFTEKGIEEIVVNILKNAGIKADERHIDETKETLEAMQRSQKRLSRAGSSFMEETVKALVQQLVSGGIIGAIIYTALKSGGHQ